MGEIKLRLIFTLDFTQHHNHRLELWDLDILQPPYLQKYADAVAGKSAPLYNCFNFVGGTIARISRTIEAIRCKIADCDYQPQKGNGMAWRHRCVLCFMNRVY